MRLLAKAPLLPSISWSHGLLELMWGEVIGLVQKLTRTGNIVVLNVDDLNIIVQCQIPNTYIAGSQAPLTENPLTSVDWCLVALSEPLSHLA